MQKKIIRIIAIIALIGVLCAILIACNKIDISTELYNGTYPSGMESLLSDEDRQLINSAVSTNDENVKKQAVMLLYNIANRSRIDTHTSLVLQESDAGIDTGTVLMHAFNLKSGNAWYYQLATQVETGNEIGNFFIGVFAGYLKVGFTLGDGEHYFFGDLGPKYECKCDIAGFPYSSYVIPKDAKGTPFAEAMNEEELKSTLHYLNSMQEINNMKFVEDIIADGAVITYNEKEKYYRVEFSVDMNADATLLQEWFALAKEDVAEGGQELKSYEYYNAVLEVWDNGYAKSFSSTSSRKAGMASGKPSDRFEYIWNEWEILELLKQDVRIDEDTKKTLKSVEDYIRFYANYNVEMYNSSLS